MPLTGGEKVAIAGAGVGAAALLAWFLWPRAPPAPTCPQGDVLATGGVCPSGYQADSSSPGCCSPVPVDVCGTSYPYSGVCSSGVCFGGSCVTSGSVAAIGWNNGRPVPVGGQIQRSPPQFLLAAPDLTSGATPSSVTASVTFEGTTFNPVTYSVGSVYAASGPYTGTFLVSLTQLSDATGNYYFGQVVFTVTYSDGSSYSTGTLDFSAQG